MGATNTFNNETTEAMNAVESGRGTADADAAIRAARAGRIPLGDMMATVLGAQVYVPLAAPPIMDGDTITRWKPATVTLAGGAQCLAAFTDGPLANAFSQTSGHPFGLLVDARWLLHVLPIGHGIAFNLGGESAFNWNAEGIVAYKLKNAP